MTTTAEPTLDQLSIEHLSVTYEVRGVRSTVLEDVSLHIRRGEAYGLVGESGCGKSTVAWAVAHHLPSNGRVEHGEIKVGERDVLGLTGEELRRWRADELAMVYQEPATSLNPTMTVGEQIMEVFQIHGLARAQAREATVDILRKVRITHPDATMRRYPHQLSGGQQQRIVIAMALAARPQLLILDEPTTGLDATVEAEVIDLVQSLRTELQASILFISHNLGLVAQLCDRIGVLYAGRIVEEGDFRQVLSNPQHPYTVGLVNCIPRMGASKDGLRLTPIPGSLPPMGQHPLGCTFGPRCASADDHCRSVEPALQAHNGRLVRCHRPGSVAREGARTGDARPYRPQPGLLDVRNVTKRFGDVLACDDITMQIGYREIVGLVGESGSGKTTLGRMIVGLAGADAGEISFEGAILAGDVGKRRRDVRRRLQMVFQSPDSTLNPKHRVAKVLKRSIDKLGGEWEVGELAERVRLEPAALQRPAARLSGGQKQRAAIARAFAGKPALVVCDEPVSALDVSVQAAVLELLADLQHETSVSYLFISHDLAVVRYLADRIIVLYLGQIVEEGPAASVFNAPHHPYTEMLVASIPTIDTRRARPTAVEREPSSAGCRFQARCAHAIDDLCNRVAPPWQELAAGHQVRCHLDRETLVEVQRRNPAIRLVEAG